MMHFSIAALLALATVSATLPSPHGHILHEKRDYTPSKWIKRNRIPSDAVLSMRVGLTQRNLDLGEEFLMDV